MIISSYLEILIIPKFGMTFLELVFYVPVFLPFSYRINKKLVGFIDISE